MLKQEVERNRGVLLQAKLPADLVAKAKAFARERGLTRSQVVEAAIRGKLARRSA